MDPEAESFLPLDQKEPPAPETPQRRIELTARPRKSPYRNNFLVHTILILLYTVLSFIIIHLNNKPCPWIPSNGKPSLYFSLYHISHSCQDLI